MVGLKAGSTCYDVLAWQWDGRSDQNGAVVSFLSGGGLVVTRQSKCFTGWMFLIGRVSFLRFFGMFIVKSFFSKIKKVAPHQKKRVGVQDSLELSIIRS